MATQSYPFVSVEEYLRVERQSQGNGRSEYYDGQIVPMLAATGNHSLICANITSALSASLRTSSCSVFDGSLRLYIPSTRKFLYPDASIVCGKATYADEHDDLLLNPVLIVEVLSPSTQSFDRGDKFWWYRSIGSFREYLLIAQDQILIEHYTLADGHWTLFERGPEADKIILQSVPAAITVADIYRQIEFRHAAD